MAFTRATARASAFGAAALLLASCASPGGGESEGRSRNSIGLDELTEQPHNTVLDAVRALRPRWLQGRTGTSFRSPGRQMPRVYVDGHARGGIRELDSLVPSEVRSIRFLSASDATTRFGTNHVAGAIVVATMRR